MARAAAQTRRKRTKAEAARRRRRAQTTQPTSVAAETMFFPKLRAHAKWVFILLALVFALGFVVFGVGSGNFGLGDLFNNNAGSSANAVSESAARKKIAENPKDASAYLELSNALQVNGDFAGAAAALAHYVKLQPKSVDGWTSLAGLYSTLGSRLQPQIQTAQLSQNPTLMNTFNSGITFKNQPVVPPNPIFQAVSQAQSSHLTDLLSKQQRDFTNAEHAYKQLAKLQPRSAPTQQLLGYAAEQAGDTTTAVAALERYLKLAPNASDTATVKQVLKQLRKSSSPTVSSG